MHNARHDTNKSNRQYTTGHRLFVCVNKHYSSGAWHELQRQSGAGAGQCAYALPRPLKSQKSVHVFADHFNDCVTNGLTMDVERTQLQWAECADGLAATSTTSTVLFTIVANIADAMDVLLKKQKTTKEAKTTNTDDQPAKKKQRMTTKTEDQLKVSVLMLNRVSQCICVSLLFDYVFLYLTRLTKPAAQQRNCYKLTLLNRPWQMKRMEMSQTQRTKPLSKC